jgi:hypothetical protein
LHSNAFDINQIIEQVSIQSQFENRKKICEIRKDELTYIIDPLSSQLADSLVKGKLNS